jgi:hypothetical protein
VSAVTSQDFISTGSLLRQSTLLLLRQGLNLALSLAAAAAAALLILYLAGRCFLSLTTACVSPQVYNWIADNAQAVQYAVATSGADLAWKIAMTVSLWGLFLLSESRRPPTSVQRTLRFAARMFVYWIVFEVPGRIFDLIMKHVVAKIDGETQLISAWLSFIAVFLVGLVAFSFLHAKLTYYPLSSLYDSEPKSFRESWNVTRGVTAVVFRAFLAIELLGAFIHLGFWYFGQLIPGMGSVSETVAGWSGVDSNVAYYVVPIDIGSGLASVLVALMTGAISIVVYRVWAARGLRVAAVFE